MSGVDVDKPVLQILVNNFNVSFNLLMLRRMSKNIFVTCDIEDALILLFYRDIKNWPARAAESVTGYSSPMEKG